MRVSSPVLVGRSGQLSVLDTALAEASGGHPSAVLVGGEAGVGKSRLVSEFAERSRGKGARVLAGGCLELGVDGLPFAPFTSMLRDLARDLGADGIAALLPGGTTRELGRLLPEFGEPAGAGDTGEARARLFEQVLVLLEQLADAGPVVMVIEDAHWADRSTRDLLAFLIRNQRALDGLLIVVIYRSDELHRSHPLRPLLAELDRVGWVTRMELGRLSRADTGELVAGLLGREPGEDVLETVYRRTEGNPLFVEALLGEGELGSGLPESLRDLLVAGVRRLPEDTQELVRVASAGGERVGHALLAAVTGLDNAGLARGLRPAVAANVLLTDSDGFVFRHALIREAMHDELLPGEGSQLHSRFAEAIGADPALVPPGRAAAEQAHHWYSAHDTTWALISAWQAAEESGHALAYAEQLAMLSRVLELWEQVPDAEQRIGASKAAVLEAAVRAAELAGEFDRGDHPGQGRAAGDRRRHRTGPGRAPAGDPRSPEEPARPRGLSRRPAGRRPAGPRRPAEPRPGPGCSKRWPTTSTTARAAGTTPSSGRTPKRPWRWPGKRAMPPPKRPRWSPWPAPEPLTGDLERIRALLAEARTLARKADAYQPLLRADITESDMLEGMGQHELAATVARAGITAARQYGLARTSGAVLAINLAEPLVSLGRWDEAERGHRARPPAPSAAAEQIIAVAAVRRHGPGPRRPRRRGGSPGVGQGRG